jgi:hypothetical protein
MDLGPVPDPAIKVFCLLLFEGTFTSFFKDKKSKRSHKTVGIKDFFYYFCLMIEGSGSVHLTSGSGSRRPKTYGSDRSGSATLQNSMLFKKLQGRSATF